MAEEAGPMETIFNNKKNLNDKFPYIPNVKHFDLHRKHFLYGKIDRVGDAIMVEETNLAATRSGKKNANFAIDFVCEAFQDFKKYYRSNIISQNLDKNSLYGNDLSVKKAWLQGDLNYSYHHYTNKLYSDFTNEYLKTDRRHEKVVDFNSFASEFLRYVGPNAYYFPLTKTGFILSYHCSPFISGLMLEIAPGIHGTEFANDVAKYVNDPNFFTGWIPEAAKKFGFMVDINAPWRLVFNIASSATNQDLGGAKYMAKKGINFENIFDSYYTKAHLMELQNLKSLLRQFYTAYYKFNRTYERLEYITPSNGGDCYTKKIILKRHGLAPPPALVSDILQAIPASTLSTLETDEYDEYFLKFLLRIRLLETKHPDTNKKFKILIKELIETKRVLGLTAALNYINNLTKGAPVSKFLRKGKYWYGMNREKYEETKREVQRNLTSPKNSSYEVTGVKGPK